MPLPPLPPGQGQRRIAPRVLEARVGPRLEQRRDAGSVALESRVVQCRPLKSSTSRIQYLRAASGIKVGTLGDEELKAVELAIESRAHESRLVAVVSGVKVGTLGDKELEAVELAVASLLHERRVAVVVFGVKLGTLGDEELKAVELAFVSASESRLHEGRACGLKLGTLGDEELVRGGQGVELAFHSRLDEGRLAVPFVFGLEVHPLLHEALEGGEVAVHRRLEKS